ncbi:molybdopterin molybdotransferase MoeA [Pseudoroseicyclus tamaricis]|uniref:Molybdopterin molybdenumtransferase n=1 Tax=Pseudoroseicyclus tamaricis TaxID=2705421 RepID=A0A6B2JU76_9RHOB|nr:gephyrin-like molybdotransferase Glp [Pseudoroseicyclus tamaricis]NDV01485.1 molybdopterin molybdotransferase MoeA [Pseudoroseicyclus tamaricis]
MITVAEALERLFALVTPLPAEEVPLTQAAGRVLARPIAARRSQPPFAASAMDGYAVRQADVAEGARLNVIGESAAGHGFSGTPAAGEAVRIFTGAPVPEGADMVILQEDVTREGDVITLSSAAGQSVNIRPAGADFGPGDSLSAPRRLSSADIALAAAMNHGTLPVTRRPEVAIIATGDELVAPGEEPGPDQIIASNTYGLYAQLQALDALPRLLPIARDNLDSLAIAFRLAEGADLVITVGGASVGDHDLVGEAAAGAGLDRSFWKVAMRPGKPLMAGRMGDAMLLGLPGNPVSALVCGQVFMAPVIDAMLGLPARSARRRIARLAAPLAANGPREHYLRAQTGPEGVTAFSKQDSSLLSVLSDADCLIVQPPNDPARPEGAEVEIVPLN